MRYESSSSSSSSSFLVKCPDSQTLVGRELRQRNQQYSKILDKQNSRPTRLSMLVQVSISRARARWPSSSFELGNRNKFRAKENGNHCDYPFLEEQETRTNPFRASIFGKKKRSKIWTDLTRKSIVHPRTESLAKSWLRVDSKASRILGYTNLPSKGW